MTNTRPQHLLVVDDHPVNLLLLEDMLGDEYVVHTVDSGEKALGYLNLGHLADLILLDIIMPGMDGFEVCRRLKKNLHTHHIPVLFITSLDGPGDEALGLSLGAEDFLHKPFSAPVVQARVRNHLRLSHATRQLRCRNDELEMQEARQARQILRQEDELLERRRQLIAAQGATITAFCSLAEARDNETGNHIRRTQNYVRALAEALHDHPRFCHELDHETIMLLYKSAPLHDIGKVAVPDAVLNKPGKLTDEEWVVMKRHAEIGRDAILQAEAEFGTAETTFLRYAREIAYSHHERWDGSGYPQGLAGEAIPVSARLMAVADVYDALITPRVYKPALSHEQAIAIIVEGRGSHFDPAVVDALLPIADSFRDIARCFNDGSGEAAWQ